MSNVKHNIDVLNAAFNSDKNIKEHLAMINEEWKKSDFCLEDTQSPIYLINVANNLLNLMPFLANIKAKQLKKYKELELNKKQTYSSTKALSQGTTIQKEYLARKAIKQLSEEEITNKIIYDYLNDLYDLIKTKITVLQSTAKAIKYEIKP